METTLQSTKLPELSRNAHSGGPLSGDRRATDCCVVGGGPGGTVLALLLARQGVDVTLLEAHQDFDRDFRGDTIHASTLELLKQLHLLERLLELPHARLADFPMHFPDGSVSPPGHTARGTRHPHSLQVPQARFIELLVSEARRYPSFHLEMHARVEQLVERAGTVEGVRYRGVLGWHEIRARLVVGADGRFSKVRQLAGMRLVGTAEPTDMLWLRLPHGFADPHRAAGIYIGDDGFLVVIDRGDAWQIGYILPKGGYQRLRAAGLEALRQSIADRASWLGDRTHHLKNWHQMSLLVVEAGCLQRWYRPGLLLIGDAAHVMSPVAGVGINYAIQDAIVASNVLGPRLRLGTPVRISDLASVQRRRERPTRLMQFLQRQMQRDLPVPGQPIRSPRWVARVMDLPPMADLRGRLINFGGFRPERVREIAPKSTRRIMAERSAPERCARNQLGGSEVLKEPGPEYLCSFSPLRPDAPTGEAPLARILTWPDAFIVEGVRLTGNSGLLATTVSRELERTPRHPLASNRFLSPRE